MNWFGKKADSPSVGEQTPTQTTIDWESRARKAEQTLKSVERSQAVIEFEPDGTILRANDAFLGAVGYSASEIVGQHHRMFVDPSYAQSASYQEFWQALGRGEFQAAEFQRFGKGGREIWIQATYTPIFDDGGSVVKVVKFATDITQQKLVQAEIQNRTQAVIEFEPDGTIITANDLFLSTVGYTLSEIKGKHHRIFMQPEDAATADYANFWRELASGNYKVGEFRRVRRDGGELWLRGAYNPVFDRSGMVEKVVKGVSDITDEVVNHQRALEIGSSVARSVTELSEAIAEISERVSRTASLAKNAAGATEQSERLVQDLGQSSSRISNVVHLIQDLADQTNLLALNATIEAARAGEAGRGFAVVATEVKALATQTTSATDDIRRDVETIQASIDDVIASIDRIKSGIDEVNNNTTNVAASVEEQTVVTANLRVTAESLVAGETAATPS